MKIKEIKIKDNTGNEFIISFDAYPTLEEINQIKATLFNNNSNAPVKTKSENVIAETQISNQNYHSIRDKLEIIVKQIKHGWFTSDHIREYYQYQFQEDIKPSTVSTYLARMFNENVLERRGSRARREYRVAEKILGPIEFPNQV